jgi:hypothetical protein
MFEAYEISDTGDVRRVSGGKGAKIGRIKRPTPNKKGYMRVFLYVGNVSHTRYLHRLVAEAFIGSCPVGKEVNHIDTNKANNSSGNLEYLTPKENNAHAIRSGVRPKTHRKSTHCRKGHEMTTDNTIIKPQKVRGLTYNARRCRLCLNKNQVAYTSRLRRRQRSDQTQRTEDGAA